MIQSLHGFVQLGLVNKHNLRSSKAKLLCGLYLMFFCGGRSHMLLFNEQLENAEKGKVEERPTYRWPSTGKAKVVRKKGSRLYRLYSHLAENMITGETRVSADVVCLIQTWSLWVTARKKLSAVCQLSQLELLNQSLNPVGRVSAF